jgi:hypothetical protein
MNPELEKILAERQARRRWLAALPFPEKIRNLVWLQAMAAPIQRAKGRTVRPWRLEAPKP